MKIKYLNEDIFDPADGLEIDDTQAAVKAAQEDFDHSALNKFFDKVNNAQDPTDVQGCLATHTAASFINNLCTINIGGNGAKELTGQEPEYLNYFALVGYNNSTNKFNFPILEAGKGRGYTILNFNFNCKYHFDYTKNRYNIDILLNNVVASAEFNFTEIPLERGRLPKVGVEIIKNYAKGNCNHFVEETLKTFSSPTHYIAYEFMTRHGGWYSSSEVEACKHITSWGNVGGHHKKSWLRLRSLGIESIPEDADKEMKEILEKCDYKPKYRVRIMNNQSGRVYASFEDKLCLSNNALASQYHDFRSILCMDYNPVGRRAIIESESFMEIFKRKRTE